MENICSILEKILNLTYYRFDLKSLRRVIYKIPLHLFAFSESNDSEIANRAKLLLIVNAFSINDLKERQCKLFFNKLKKDCKDKVEVARDSNSRTLSYWFLQLEEISTLDPINPKSKKELFYDVMRVYFSSLISCDCWWDNLNEALNTCFLNNKMKAISAEAKRVLESFDPAEPVSKRSREFLKHLKYVSRAYDLKLMMDSRRMIPCKNCNKSIFFKRAKIERMKIVNSHIFPNCNFYSNSQYHGWVLSKKGAELWNVSGQEHSLSEIYSNKNCFKYKFGEIIFRITFNDHLNYSFSKYIYGKEIILFKKERSKVDETTKSLIISSLEKFNNCSGFYFLQSNWHLGSFDSFLESAIEGSLVLRHTLSKIMFFGNAEISPLNDKNSICSSFKDDNYQDFRNDSSDNKISSIVYFLSLKYDQSTSSVLLSFTNDFFKKIDKSLVHLALNFLCKSNSCSKSKEITTLYNRQRKRYCNDVCYLLNECGYNRLHYFEEKIPPTKLCISYFKHCKNERRENVKLERIVVKEEKSENKNHIKLRVEKKKLEELNKVIKITDKKSMSYYNLICDQSILMDDISKLNSISKKNELRVVKVTNDRIEIKNGIYQKHSLSSCQKLKENEDNLGIHKTYKDCLVKGLLNNFYSSFCKEKEIKKIESSNASISTLKNSISKIITEGVEPYSNNCNPLTSWSKVGNRNKNKNGKESKNLRFYPKYIEFNNSNLCIYNSFHCLEKMEEMNEISLEKISNLNDDKSGLISKEEERIVKDFLFLNDKVRKIRKNKVSKAKREGRNLNPDFKESHNKNDFHDKSKKPRKKYKNSKKREISGNLNKAISFGKVDKTLDFKTYVYNLTSYGLKTRMNLDVISYLNEENRSNKVNMKKIKINIERVTGERLKEIETVRLFDPEGLNLKFTKFEEPGAFEITEEKMGNSEINKKEKKGKEKGKGKGEEKRNKGEKEGNVKQVRKSEDLNSGISEKKKKIIEQRKDERRRRKMEELSLGW